MKLGVPKKGKRCSSPAFFDAHDASSPQFIHYTEGKNDQRIANSDELPHRKSKSFSELRYAAVYDLKKLDPSLRSGLVLKFGGSSVGGMPSLGHVLDIIAKEANRSDELLVVIVSAPGPTTDLLIDASTLATSGDLSGSHEIVDRIADLCIYNAFHASTESPSIAAPVRQLLVGLKKLLEGVSLTRECTPRALDMILSFGERLSALMMGWLLSWRNISRDVAVVDSREWIITGPEFGHAAVHVSDSYRALQELRPLWGSRIAIMTGFIGRTRDGGYTTTLGRNGSDFTATLAGAGLKVRSVVINTDVQGVHTADPGIVPTAVPVKKLSYELCLELSIYSSARLFHPRTMLPLICSDIPMAIRSTQDINGPCTIICNEALLKTEGDGIGPTCVTSLEHQSVLEMHSRLEEGTASLGRRFLRALEKSSIVVSLGIQAAHGQSFSALVSNEHFKKAEAAILEEFSAEFTAMEVDPLVKRENVTMLSLVVNNLLETKDVARRFFYALSVKDIACAHMATGPRSLSCTIDAKDTAAAVRAVHDAFHFSRQLSLVTVCDSGDDEDDCVETLFDLLRLRDATIDELDIVVVGTIQAEHHNNQAMMESAKGDQESLHCDEQPETGNRTLFNCRYCPEGVIDLSQKIRDEGMTGPCNNNHAKVKNEIVSLSAHELLKHVSELPLPVLVDCRRKWRSSDRFDDMGHTLKGPIIWKRAMEFMSDVDNNDVLQMNALDLGINIINSHVFGALQLLAQPAMFGRCICENRRMGMAHLMFNTAISRSSLPILQMLRGVLKAGITPARMEICFGEGLGAVLQYFDDVENRERSCAGLYTTLPAGSFLHEFSGRSATSYHSLNIYTGL